MSPAPRGFLFQTRDLLTKNDKIDGVKRPCATAHLFTNPGIRPGNVKQGLTFLYYERYNLTV